MRDNLKEKVYQFLEKQFHIPVAILQQKGASISPDDKRKSDGTQTIWTLENHSIIHTHSDHFKAFNGALEEGKMLSKTAILEKLSVEASGEGIFYFLDVEDFKPISSKYSIRKLAPEDKDAFEAFHNACSEDDRESSEIDFYSDEVVFGVFDGKNIIAASSTYDFMGLIDIGVLTAESYRKQGLAKAVAATLMQYYLNRQDPRMLFWRHNTDNPASQKVAEALGFKKIAQINAFKFK